ncbi:hypothetical protein ABT354_12480 [Streptomyces sp. NPDC000594]|uniref:cyanobactin maturation protease PatG family protein n=1 Tax=Streptomyces sp. NPDC000594 TaxID=3154261 RepID=UPI003325ECC5
MQSDPNDTPTSPLRPPHPPSPAEDGALPPPPAPPQPVPGSLSTPEAAPDGLTSGVTQACGCGCGTPGDDSGDASAEPGFVYVLGQVNPVFPDASVQHEFFQAAGVGDIRDASEAEAMHRVLSDPENRYIARQMCYVLAVQGVDTYILVPADPTELIDLLEALHPVKNDRGMAVVVGHRGPVAPPGLCQGLSVPVVGVEKIWSFDRKHLFRAIKRPGGAARKEFESGAKDLFQRLIQLNDNAGADPADRAINYLAVRSEQMYLEANRKRDDGYILTQVEAGPSRLSSGAQTVVTVVFSFTHRQTNVTDKFAARVDVSGLYPFTVTPPQPYYDR